jgi:hypothetical protein
VDYCRRTTLYKNAVETFSPVNQRTKLNEESLHYISSAVMIALDKEEPAKGTVGKVANPCLRMCFWTSLDARDGDTDVTNL